LSTKGKLPMLWILVGCVVSFLSGCSVLPKEEAVLPPPIALTSQQPLMTAEVKLGSITKQLVHSATVVAKVQKALSFQQSGGRLQSFTVKIGDRVKRGQVVASIDPGDLENSIYVQKIMVEKADLLYQQAKRSDANNVIDLRLKLLDLEAAQDELNRLQNELSATELISPIDGIVTYIDDVKEYDTIDAQVPIIVISDPSQLQLIAEFENADAITDVAIGAKVEVNLDLNHQVYQGYVIQTPKTAPTVVDPVQQNQNQSSLIIHVDDLPAGVAEGMNVTVKIILAQKNNVLIIPKEALSNSSGNYTVHVLNKGARREVGINIGIETASEVEITKGLTAGQVVILN